MKAYQCDRCGCFFDTITLNNDDFVIKKVIYTSYFDLCEKCQFALKVWFNMYKNESEEQ